MGIINSLGLFASWCNIVAFSQNVLLATMVFTLNFAFSNNRGNFSAANDYISNLSDGSHEASGPISSNISGLR